MIRNYRDLTRLEMEQVNREETIVLIPLGALEQHGNQAPLGTDDIIAEAMTRYLKKELEAQDPDFPMLIFPRHPRRAQHRAQKLLRLHHLQARHLLSHAV